MLSSSSTSTWNCIRTLSHSFLPTFISFLHIVRRIIALHRSWKLRIGVQIWTLLILVSDLIYCFYFHVVQLLFRDVNLNYFILILWSELGYFSLNWLLVLVLSSLNLIQATKLFFVIGCDMLLDHIGLVSWLLMLGYLLEILLLGFLVFHLYCWLSIALSLLETDYL